MTSYEKQRKELEARVSESEEAVLRAHSMRRNVEHLVRKEQEAFDALLKNPDFQRWLRLMHEAWRGCAWCQKVEAVGFRQHGSVRLPICAECIGSAERGKPPLGTPPAWLSSDQHGDNCPDRKPAPTPCPYAVLGCDARSRCEDCRKDEAPMQKQVSTGPDYKQGMTFDPPVTLEQVSAAADALRKTAPKQTSVHDLMCHTVRMTGKDAWPACTCATIAKMHPDDQKTGLNTVRDAAGNPRQRAHVNGCVLDATHDGPCMSAKPTDSQMKARGEWLDSRGAPALSPRQALGEALAAVDRALSLLQSAYRSGTRETVDAMNDLKSAGDKLARAYEAAK